MSTVTAAKKRASKPLMEKKRRDRINQSLAQLKELIEATSTNQYVCRRNRMEKADILELAVQHVHRLHESKGGGGIPSPTQRQMFVDGFVQCVREIKNYLHDCDAKLNDERNLLRHLDTCVTELSEMSAAGEREGNDGQQPSHFTFLWRPWF